MHSYAGESYPQKCKGQYHFLAIYPGKSCGEGIIEPHQGLRLFPSPHQNKSRSILDKHTKENWVLLARTSWLSAAHSHVHVQTHISMHKVLWLTQFDARVNGVYVCTVRCCENRQIMHTEFGRLFVSEDHAGSYPTQLATCTTVTRTLGPSDRSTRKTVYRDPYSILTSMAMSDSNSKTILNSYCCGKANSHTPFQAKCVHVLVLLSTVFVYQTLLAYRGPFSPKTTRIEFNGETGLLRSYLSPATAWPQGS